MNRWPGHKADSAAACCTLCSTTPGCAFWSFNPGHPGSCFPKSVKAANHSTPHMAGYAWGACPVRVFMIKMIISC